MPFAFKLESLLRLRRGIERQEEQKLLALAGQVLRLRSRLQRIEESRLSDQRALQSDLAQEGTGAALQFAAQCDTTFLSELAKVRQELARAEERRHAQLRRFQEARQRRDILESLRAREKESYDQQFMRSEQQKADEAFLLRSFVEKRE